MRQSRSLSLVEAGANVLVGFWIAVLTQMTVFPDDASASSTPLKLGEGNSAVSRQILARTS